VDHFVQQWQWRYGITTPSASSGSTSHSIYVTLGEPSGLTEYAYVTLLEFTCDWAEGETTYGGVFQEVWSPIASRSATGYSYRIGTLPELDLNTTRGLIIKQNGRCGAWMRFFHDLLAVHGISAPGYGLEPTYGGLLRVPASRPGQGYPPVPDENEFEDHGVNGYGANLYDPSYGTGPFTSVLDLEDASIEAYTDGGVWQPDVKGVLELNVSPGL
jgi:hypothetical protein